MTDTAPLGNFMPEAFGTSERVFEPTSTSVKCTAPEGGVDLAQVVDVFRRHLHLPDPGALYAVLAAVAANRLDGDPVWLVVVGPSGGGKTEILNALADLEHVHAVATLSGDAALLSGTSRKERAADAKGGLLRVIGDYGVLVLKDLGSILSMHRDARANVLAALREIYDGSWVRHVGVDGGRELAWEGKLGLVAGCVPTLDQHYAVMATLGERFLLYRLAVDEAPEHARRSLAHAGAVREMRAELRQAVRGLFSGIQLSAPAPFCESDVNRLVALSVLVVRARSLVVRDGYSREIEMVPDAEAPGRLVMQLGQLLLGLRAIGVDESEAWRVLVKAGLDSMPALRWAALELLIRNEGSLRTSEVARVLDVPKKTVNRVLEDLTAHHVIERRSMGEKRADEWIATAWAVEQHRVSTAPEMSSAVGTRDLRVPQETTPSDISGAVSPVGEAAS